MKEHIIRQIQKHYFTTLVIMIIILLVANIAAQAETYIDSGDVTVAVSERIELSGPAAFIDSYRSQDGAYAPMSATSEAIITVNSVTSNSVSLFNDAVINGYVYTGPGSDTDRSIRTWDKKAITEGADVLKEQVVLPKIILPDAAPFNEDSTGNLILGYNEQVVADYDMHIDDLTLTSQSTLTVEGSVVIMVEGDVSIGEEAQLVITPGSTLDLYVKGRCDISGWMNVTSADPQALYIFMTGKDNTFEMFDAAAVYCVLQNPEGAVNLHEQTQFFGRIRAKSLKSMGGIHVDLDSGFATLNGSGGKLKLKPVEGKLLVAGIYYDIEWTTEGAVDNVLLEYSADAGDTWTKIDTIMNVGSYQWIVPDETSQDCYLRILDAGDVGSGSVSEAFTIYVCQLLYDLNGDCRVDTKDAEIMAREWMTCGNPFDPECD